MPRYRITLDNGQSFVKEDARGFKDFCDWLKPSYDASGKRVALVTNLDFPEDLGVNIEGEEIELSAAIHEKAAPPAPPKPDVSKMPKTKAEREKLRAEEKKVEGNAEVVEKYKPRAGTHQASKLRGSLGGNDSE